MRCGILFHPLFSVAALVPFALGSVTVAHAQADPVEPFRVVTFGDSITAAREGVTPFTAQLQRWADDTGRRLAFTNAGVPGNTTRDAKVRFERDVLAHRPALVVVEFGLNDSAVDVWKDPPAAESRVSLEEYAAHLHYFIAALEAAGSKVVLLTPNPICWTPKLRSMYNRPPYEPDEVGGMMVPVWPYLDAMRGVAAQRGIVLVDIAALYMEMPEAKTFDFLSRLPDGMHPNDEAHALVAERLRPVLDALLPEAIPAGMPVGE